MNTLSRNRRLFARTSRTDKTSALRRRRATLLNLEYLEDRLTPATFTLTSLLDDGTIGTLRDAINQANANHEINKIIIPPSLDIGPTFEIVHIKDALGNITDVLKEVDHNIIALTGSQLPTITSTLTIVGDDPRPDSAITSFTISGEGLSSILRVGINGNLTLDKLTIANGNSTSFGGAISNLGSLVLEDVTVKDSTAQNGGGIANSGGSLTVTNSTITNNHAASSGGGIWTIGGSASIDHSTISDNSVMGHDNASLSPASAPIDNSGSSASGGGLAVVGGTASVTFTTISGNVVQGGAGGPGGDAANLGSQPAQSNPFEDPKAGRTGGSGVKGGDGGDATGGGIEIEQASLNIFNSTLSNNIVRGGKGGVGGSGGRGEDGQTATGVDINGNGEPGGAGGAGGRGGDGGAGGLALGGGLFASPLAINLSLTNTTVAGNQAVGGQGNRSGAGAQGGNGGDGTRGANPTGGQTGAGDYGRGGVGGAGGNGGTTVRTGRRQGAGVHFSGSSTIAAMKSSTVAYNDVLAGLAAVTIEVPDPKFPPNSGRTIFLPANGAGGEGGVGGRDGQPSTGIAIAGAAGSAGNFARRKRLRAGALATTALAQPTTSL